jgi:hypothetical protein
MEDGYVGRVVSPQLTEIDHIRSPLTEGEKKVLDLFIKCLSDDWEIYTQPLPNGCSPYFVLMHPRAGVAVIEVKD